MRKTDIPTYEMVIDPLEKGGNIATGFDAIAYVADPAIEEMGVYLSANDLIVEEVNLKLSNEEKQQVVAPLLIPNKLIPRNDKGFYNITFSSEVIQQLKAKADNEGKLKSLNIFKNTHRGNVAPAFIIEDWIIEDENDKAYTEYGFDIERIPVGTWMVISQVIDKKFWDEEIKMNKKFAYSIEAFMNMKMVNLKLNKIEMAKSRKVKLSLPTGRLVGEDGTVYEIDENGQLSVVIEEETVLEEVSGDTKEVKEELAEEAKEAEELEETVSGETKEVEMEDEIKEELEEEKEELEEDEIKEEIEEKKEEVKEELEGEEDKFEAVYEEIAKLKTLVSELMEAQPKEDKVEMNTQGSIHSSIVALRNARKSNK